MHIAIVLTEANTDIVTTLTGHGSLPELVLPAARLSTALAVAGHDVTVYTPSAEVTESDEVMSAQGYRVIRLPAGKLRRKPDDAAGASRLGEFTQHLEQAWHTERPDVVHAQSWLSGMAGQFAARLHSIPVVQSFDSLSIEERRTGGAPDAAAADRCKLESLLTRGASWVAANNTAEMFELLRMGGARSRISVLPCGVDSEVFTPPGATAERGATPYRIVAVGSALGRQDFDTAIRALAMLPDTELVIAFDATCATNSDECARLRDVAAAAGVADRTVVQRVQGAGELAELLRSADVSACTPRTEPTGAAALMAMSCGVPVIATSVGALADIVVDEVTGRLIPTADVAAFADAARRLLHEPFAGRGMGAAGRDRARSRYSWERVAGDALRAYSGALGVVGAASA